MIGVYDQYKVQHLLCRVGKVAISDDSCGDISCLKGAKFMAQAFFTSNVAKLKDEGIFRNYRLSRPIDYQAYDITYAQYIEFIRILHALQTDEHQFSGYQPIQEEGDQVILKYTKKFESNSLKPNIDKIKKGTEELSLGNTCRHTAIALVEEVQQAPISSSISSNFISSLPCSTVLEYGKPVESIPFYVLPVSPAVYPDLDGKKKQILEKLYKRMEHMLLIDPHSKHTQDKFTRLKNLYMNIAGPQKDLSLDELLVSIQKWKQENQPLLSHLRQRYMWDFFFTRQSATISLVNEIEKDLGPNVPGYK
jgi:hypothetical protein